MYGGRRRGGRHPGAGRARRCLAKGGGGAGLKSRAATLDPRLRLSICLCLHPRSAGPPACLPALLCIDLDWQAGPRTGTTFPSRQHTCRNAWSNKPVSGCVCVYVCVRAPRACLRAPLGPTAGGTSLSPSPPQAAAAVRTATPPPMAPAPRCCCCCCRRQAARRGGARRCVMGGREPAQPGGGAQAGAGGGHRRELGGVRLERGGPGPAAPARGRRPPARRRQRR